MLHCLEVRSSAIYALHVGDSCPDWYYASLHIFHWNPVTWKYDVGMLLLSLLLLFVYFWPYHPYFFKLFCKTIALFGYKQGTKRIINSPRSHQGRSTAMENIISVLINSPRSQQKRSTATENIISVLLEQGTVGARRRHQPECYDFHRLLIFSPRHFIVFCSTLYWAILS